MPDRRRAFVVPPRGRKTIRGPVGGRATIGAPTENTSGTFAPVDNIIPAKAGPLLHVHLREDETWIVLDGDFRFKVDNEILAAPAGSIVFVPRGTRHCFQNVGDEPARILVMFAPNGRERFFEGLAELPWGPVDPETYKSVATSSRMEVVGPPLSDSDPL